MSINTFFKRSVSLVFSLFLILLCFAVDINEYVIASADEYIISAENAAALENIDCILILGCGIRNNSPSPLLQDRLLRGIELYQAGISDRLLMTGDHGHKTYDEVNVMRTYAEESGIPTEHIFMDHAGFSTYESMYRARDIFCAKKIIIVTQRYHLSRAIYIARSLGLEAYGVASDYQTFAGQEIRNIREALARTKDFLYVLFKPQPTYLGERIPISGNGLDTHG